MRATVRKSKLTGFRLNMSVFLNLHFFRQNDEASQQEEEGSRQGPDAPQVSAKILRRAFELRSAGLSVGRPHPVLPSQRPRPAAGVQQEWVSPVNSKSRLNGLKNIYCSFGIG